VPPRPLHHLDLLSVAGGKQHWLLLPTGNATRVLLPRPLQHLPARATRRVAPSRGKGGRSSCAQFRSLRCRAWTAA